MLVAQPFAMPPNLAACALPHKSKVSLKVVACLPVVLRRWRQQICGAVRVSYHLHLQPWQKLPLAANKDPHTHTKKENRQTNKQPNNQTSKHKRSHTYADTHPLTAGIHARKASCHAVLAECGTLWRRITKHLPMRQPAKTSYFFKLPLVKPCVLPERQVKQLQSGFLMATVHALSN